MLYGGKKLLGTDAEELQKLQGLFRCLDIVPNRDTDVFERFFLVRAERPAARQARAGDAETSPDSRRTA